MRILITGASGLLGSNLAFQAAEEHQVIGIDQIQIYPRSFQFHQADLLAKDAVPSLLDTIQPDWIIHCAANANVDACEEKPEAAKRLNAVLPGLIAEETAKRNLSMVYISTDAVFNGKKGMYTEKDNPDPQSVYAQTKLDGERAVANANSDAIIARVNFYGWSLPGNRSLAEFFANNLKENKAVNGFSDVKYCPLVVSHLADTLLEMLAKDLHGLYHVVSSESLSKYQFAVRLAEIFGFNPELISPISVFESNLKAARSPNLTLDTSKLAKAIGHATQGIEEGLNLFHKMYLDQYPAKLRQMLNP